MNKLIARSVLVVRLCNALFSMGENGGALLWPDGPLPFYQKMNFSPDTAPSSLVKVES